MKKQLVLLSLLVAGSVATTMAQTREKYYSESAKDNWYIGVGFGGQAIVSQNNKDYKFSETITPTFTITAGRWINPIWGYRGQFSGWNNKMWGEPTSKGTERRMYDKSSYRLHADAVFNITNAIADYKANRLFTLSAFAGPGVTFAKYLVDMKSNNVNAVVNGSVGLLGLFNISDCWDVNIEVRGDLSPSIFHLENNQYTDGHVAGLVGITYTFGGKKFAPVIAKVNTEALNQEINRYREALANAESELTRAKAALLNAKSEIKEVVTVKEVEVPVVTLPAIFFSKGQSRIDASNRMNLEMIVEMIKANPNKKYKVAGYADKATGTEKQNKELSEKRAKAVYDALIKAGVSEAQLDFVGVGGIERFGQLNLNRVVILE